MMRKVTRKMSYFEMWIDNEGVISHSYYQKPTKTPFVLPARSAMAHQQKLQILSNDLTRRLSNVQEEKISQEEKNKIIEKFIEEMKSSEYCIKLTREAVTSGIRGWRKRGIKRKRDGQNFHRLANETLKLVSY